MVNTIMNEMLDMGFEPLGMCTLIHRPLLSDTDVETIYYVNKKQNLNSFV